MGIIDYPSISSISVKNLIDACNELEPLIIEKGKLTSNSTNNTITKNNYAATLRDIITTKAHSIVKRRKIIKIILLLLSFCAIDYICDQIGAVSDIVYGTGYIICIIIFLISWFKKIGTDFNKIIDQLNRKYSSDLHTSQELDKQNAKMADSIQRENDVKIQMVESKISNHQYLYKIINDYVEMLGAQNDWEYDYSLYVNRLLTSLRLKCTIMKQDAIVNGSELLSQCFLEEGNKISTHAGGYHTSLY